MGVTNRLIYDGTDADTIASSSTVGSHVLSGADGSPIGHETLNSVDWLRVSGVLVDSTGQEVGVTAGALDINISGGSIVIGSDYAEDSAHTTADTGSFVLSVRADDLTAVPAGILAGTEGDYQAFVTGPNGELFIGADQLDIDDLNATDDAVASWLHDGLGTAITSSGGAIDVNIASGVSLDVDDDLADTDINNVATPVSTTAVNCVTTALAGRKFLAYANEGNKTVYFGENGITTSTGFPCHPGQQAVWRVGPSVAPQFIGRAGASSEDVRVMELS